MKLFNFKKDFSDSAHNKSKYVNKNVEYPNIDDVERSEYTSLDEYEQTELIDKRKDGYYNL